MRDNLILTPDQIRAARELIGSLDVALDAGVDGDDEAYRRSMRAAVELSGHILRPKYIMPRAINLLSFKPEGSFLSYLQLMHITAAIRYVLGTVCDPTDEQAISMREVAAIDGEISQYLSPPQSPAFSYCVQVHAACNSFGLNHQLPTITWATDGLNSGALLTLTSLKHFLRELYRSLLFEFVPQY
ncbi:hypothetical protein V1504DRAFT_430619 [Lipomyces starkeyi]